MKTVLHICAMRRMIPTLLLLAGVITNAGAATWGGAAPDKGSSPGEKPVLPQAAVTDATTSARVLLQKDSLKMRWWDPAEHNVPVIEGQAWPDETRDFYDRLPARAERTVRDAVWKLSQDAAGLVIRFRSDARLIQVRYQVQDPLDMAHMPSTGVSGVDLYSREDGGWNWIGGKRSFRDTVTYTFQSIEGNPDREYYLYLPLYNKVKWLQVGVPDDAMLHFLPARDNGTIVVYGTSIAQGGCASRPGLAWTAMLGRKLDRPVVNLAFSGNGRLEEALCDLLLELNPSLYVVDCLPNMRGFPDDTIKARLTKTVTSLRRQKPGIPVLIVENADATINSLNSLQEESFDRVNILAREAFDAMKAGGLKDIYLLPASEIGLGIESTVDGVHPNDIGMQEYARAYEKAIRKILRRPPGN